MNDPLARDEHNTQHVNVERFNEACVQCTMTLTFAKKQS